MPSSTSSGPPEAPPSLALCIALYAWFFPISLNWKIDCSMDYDHALCFATVRPWFNWNLWFLGIWFSESHCNVRRSWLALVSSLSLVISFVHSEKWSIYLWACFISSYLGLTCFLTSLWELFFFWHSEVPNSTSKLLVITTKSATVNCRWVFWSFTCVAKTYLMSEKQSSKPFYSPNGYLFVQLHRPI